MKRVIRVGVRCAVARVLLHGERRLFELKCLLPIDTCVKVRIKDYSAFGRDELIGETVIDVENRVYSRHRATCGLPAEYFMYGYDVTMTIA